MTYLLGRSNFLLRTFCLIGIAPYSDTTKIKNLAKSVARFIPVFLSLLLSLCLTIFLLIFPHFESLGPIHTIINFSYVLSLYLTILSANCQCYFYKSAYHRTKTQIRQIQNGHRSRSWTKFIFQFQIRYRIKVLLIFILFFASQGLVFLEVWLISDSNGLWSSFIISSLRILYPMHILHIIFYCDIITMFLKNINMQARDSAICLLTSNKVEFLKNIKLAHMELTKLVAHINLFFGWNLLFLMINSFIYISYQLYWIFLSLQLQWGVLAIIGKKSR